MTSGSSRGAEGGLIWGILLHLSYNMWGDWDVPDAPSEHWAARPYLRFDEGLWNDLLAKAVTSGLNMVVIDVGDGVRYESHPEIAVQGAWTPDRLRAEIKRLRGMGLELIPKLNFSTCHDAWLGPYARCVSTDTYYGVCRDLIAETIDLFDQPRFFHLGMDKETAQHQRRMEYVVIRQFDLWWRDLYFYLEQVEKGGVRPWVWSDYLWHHPEPFWQKMPRSVLQSNWYYHSDFSPQVTDVRAYGELDAHGYDQVPTGSNWAESGNFQKTVEHCRRAIAPARLKGFLQTVWYPTVEAWRSRHLEAIAEVAEAKASW